MTELTLINRCAVLALGAFALAGCPGEPHALEQHLPAPPKRVALKGAAGDVQEAVEQYYDAYNNHSFADADQFTTEDWNFLDAYGGWVEGRDDVIDKQDDAHAGFLKKTEQTLMDMSVVFATKDVAVVTATSRGTPFTDPHGAKHEYDGLRSTFVVVERDGEWRVMQTQQTSLDAPVAGTTNVGELPADASGEPQSDAERQEQIDAAITWYKSLPKTHDFDAARDFATSDLNVITPDASWYRSRVDAMTRLRPVFTTFLDSVKFTPLRTTVRFASDAVAVVTETNKLSPFVLPDGTKRNQDRLQNTYVVVNRDGDWRLLHAQATTF